MSNRASLHLSFLQQTNICLSIVFCPSRVNLPVSMESNSLSCIIVTTTIGDDINMKPTTIIITISLALFACSALKSEDDLKGAAEQTITMEELKDHMYYLASEELGGRVWNQPGYEIAAKYAVTQFRAAGLKTLFKDEQGKDTYLQKVIMKETHYTDKTRWILSVKGKTYKYKPGVGIRSKHPGAVEKGPIDNFYFLGYGISEPEEGWDDIKDLDLSDKTIVVTLGTPQKAGKPVLSEKTNRKYLGSRGLQTKLQALKDRGAKRISVLIDKELEVYWKALHDVVSIPKRSVSTPKEDLSTEIIMNQETGSLLFKNADYSPYSSNEEGYKTFPLEGISLTLKAEKREDVSYTWNVVGLIPGTHETLKDEYIVVGGHLDHIPPQDGAVCNGADDNASGSIAVIETGEALAMKNNKRSILVCLWGAEEIGVYGSQFFVANPPVSLEKIKANVNLDMIARSDNKSKVGRAIYALGTENFHPSFGQFLKKVNEHSVNWPLSTDGQRYRNIGSDHLSFAAEGIPAVFFFSGTHKDYHKPTDDPENLDWEKFLKVARLGCCLTDKLANADFSLDSFKAASAGK